MSVREFLYYTFSLDPFGVMKKREDERMKAYIAELNASSKRMDEIMLQQAELMAKRFSKDANPLLLDVHTDKMLQLQMDREMMRMKHIQY